MAVTARARVAALMADPMVAWMSIVAPDGVMLAALAWGNILVALDDDEGGV